MELTPHELEDVTRTVLGEAASEGYKGQVAVASVIANRMADNRFPGTATGVAKQGNKFGYHQFSTWNAPNKEGSPTARNVSKLSAAYKAAEKAVLDVFQGKVTDPTKGAVNYYSPSGMKPAGRVPSWAKATEKQNLSVIGGHRFSGKVNDMAAYDAFWSRTPDPLSGYPASPIDVEYQLDHPATGLAPTPTARPGLFADYPQMAVDPQFQSPRDGIPSFAARPDPFTAPTPTSRPSSVPGQVPGHAISGSPFGSVRGANTPSYSGIGSPGNATTRGAPAFSAPSFSGQIGSAGNATSRGMAPSAPSFSSQPATPMSRQQNLGTPADPMGVPSDRISGVMGITNPSPTTPTAPAFNPIPAAELAAYQQYARARAPAIAPIAAPVVAPAPIAPSAKQPTFAEKMGKKAVKAAPAAILGAISPIAGALYGIAQHAGVFDKTGLFEPNKGLFAKDFSAAKGTDADYNPAGVLSAAQGAITPDTMQAHTTPSGAVNYSGASSSMPGWGAVTNGSGVTTMSDPVSGVSATSGAGGGEGGGTVLCTYYHSIGWLDDETYAHDALYGMTVDQDALAGYHLWAVPFATKLPQHKWLRRFLWYPVKLWAHSMAKPNALWSRVIRCFGEGICKLIARSLKPNMAVFPQRKGQNIGSVR